MLDKRFITSPAGQEALCLIRAASRLYVTVHITPDGDTVGSALGLVRALTRLGKHARAVCADPVPYMYEFLPGADSILAQKPERDELLVVLDSSDLGRLGWLYDEALYRDRPLLNIDHHVTNVRFGSVNWVEPDAASTAEIMVELVQALGATLDEQIATCLLTGIVTDTLGFRTSSTTPELMETAGELMRAGAPLGEIIERTFNRRELSDLQLQGRVLASMHVEDGLIWSDNTMQMRRESGAAESAGSSIGNTLLSARNAKVSIMFIEKEKGRVEVSIRARAGFDISGIAFSLGGGGHPQAAGCKLNATLVEAHAQVLPAVRELLAESNGRA